MKKVYVGKSRFGRGIFAVKDIKNRELIGIFTGRKYHRKLASELPKEVRDYSVQIGQNTYIDSKKSIGHYTNHSCEPNAGIKGLRRLVAMRKIRKGEEIFFDYAMTEDSDWRMRCHCGTKSCRKIIGAWSMLPLKTKRKYRNWTSSWILKKEGWRI